MAHSVITKFHLWLIKNGNYGSHPSSFPAANHDLRSQELKLDGTITSSWVSELHSHFFLMHALNLVTWKCRSGFSDFFQGNKNNLGSMKNPSTNSKPNETLKLVFGWKTAPEHKVGCVNDITWKWT